MAQAKHTYAIRLSVDGGGKVKAELMDVGRAGDKSLKKIETAGSKASLGLTKLSDRAQSLGRNMKLLYGAIAAGGAIRGLQEMVKLYADFEAGLIGVGKTSPRRTWPPLAKTLMRCQSGSQWRPMNC